MLHRTILPRAPKNTIRAAGRQAQRFSGSPPVTALMRQIHPPYHLQDAPTRSWDQSHSAWFTTPSPGPPRLKKAPGPATLSPKGERAGIPTFLPRPGSQEPRRRRKSSAECIPALGQALRGNDNGFPPGPSSLVTPISPTRRAADLKSGGPRYSLAPWIPAFAGMTTAFRLVPRPLSRQYRQREEPRASKPEVRAIRSLRGFPLSRE
jgi:hypothetical protein